MSEEVQDTEVIKQGVVAVQIRGTVSCFFYTGFLKLVMGSHLVFLLGDVASGLGQLEANCTSVNP
jgi:hypothetical protein